MYWAERGLCRSQPDRMFAEGAAQAEAKTVCVECPVRLDCLAYALDHREEYGVWGAMTERERRALLRRRPAVTSWAEAFRAARTYEDTLLISVPRQVEQPPAHSPARPRRSRTGGSVGRTGRPRRSHERGGPTAGS
ncbi:WhiB family transcriptional regulator [Streptomyces sp. NPDC093516]|uniref:WhiB family transcriptional regulator n=1 Tax=Streptomyces sp. NPDC093516 TaxID=3155304 RepID=UPI0034120EE3